MRSILVREYLTYIVARQPTEKQSQEAPGGLPNAKELEQRIYLTLQVPKSKAYLNEIVPVTIKMHINKLGVRDIQYPKFKHDGFSIGEFEKAKQYLEDYVKNDDKFKEEAIFGGVFLETSERSELAKIAAEIL